MKSTLFVLSLPLTLVRVVVGFITYMLRDLLSDVIESRWAFMVSVKVAVYFKFLIVDLTKAYTRVFELCIILTGLVGWSYQPVCTGSKAKCNLVQHPTHFSLSLLPSVFAI